MLGNNLKNNFRITVLTLFMTLLRCATVQNPQVYLPDGDETFVLTEITRGDKILFAKNDSKIDYWLKYLKSEAFECTKLYDTPSNADLIEIVHKSTYRREGAILKMATKQCPMPHVVDSLICEYGSRREQLVLVTKWLDCSDGKGRNYLYVQFAK
jgi:hypothetical protein